MSGFKTDYVDVRIYRWKKKESEMNELLNELEYTNTDGVVYKVPKGFTTDFASIPRILRNIIAPTGKWTNASILHDFLYDKGYQLGVTRKQADKIFYNAMIDSSVARITANIMWFCVRVFARSHYARG